MLIKYNFAPDRESARGSDARSIGSVINGLREVAALREKVRQEHNLLNFASPSHVAHAARRRALRCGIG